MPNSKDFNRFSVNPVNIDISRSLFNMDHSVKFSANIGSVVPFEVTEVVPGDTFTVDTHKVVRLQPLVAPIMDEVILDVYYFFVPYRLVWTHWKEFMGENNDSAWAPSVTYSIPKITPPVGGFDVGTIADYMGIPVGVRGDAFSALPFRSYALICSQWFRSEALMDPVHVHVDDTNRTGVNTGDQVTDIELGGQPFIACKFPDYFTSCLPAPQRGDAVTVPILDPDNTHNGVLYAPVQSFDNDNLPVGIVNENIAQRGKSLYSYSSPLSFTYNNNGSFDKLNSPHSTIITSSGNANGKNALASISANYDGNMGYTIYPDNLYAMVQDTDFNFWDINDLRTAFAVQKYLEKQARYGGRYVEYIKAFFNVDSPDARQQRTEYLGGNRLSLNINQVEQTSATQSDSTPLGNVAGMSVTADSNSDFTKSFTEHGLLIGVSVLRYHHSYSQGLERFWTRKTPYDFYNPVFANLGEQRVNLSEIYYGSGNTTKAFGYQERWSEYRYKPNRIAGELRPQSAISLDMWHLGDNYASAPSLNATWLREDKTNLDRCLAVTSEVANQCICDFYIEMKASRPMPMYSIPGLIDHH